MVLKLSLASPEDVDRIATVHLASFDSNPLLHAQFPTAASLASLHSVLCQEMLLVIGNPEDSRESILVVRDSTAENQIISFAKWDLPTFQRAPQSEIIWHGDVKEEYLDVYHDLAESAKQRVIGNAPCYSKIFLLIRLRKHF
jgi:hypothetical protein